MNNRKVCILTETYLPDVGGGETQARILAEELAAKNFSVVLLTRRSDISYKRIEKLGQIKIFRLGPVGKKHLKKWGLLFTSIPALIKHRKNYDLIFVSGFRVLGVSAVIISKLLGKSCILKADSLGEMSGEFFADGLDKLHLNTSSLIFKIFLKVRNSILEKADAFVAVSKEVAEELANHDVSPEKVQAIPNCVDTKVFCPVDEKQKQALRRKLGIPEKTRIVTFTGRLVTYKGLPLLLRVWKEISRKHGDACLYLIGSGGLDIHNCEAELRKYVRTNDLQNSMHFTGSVNNVHEYLKASDIFVFPTENEAFGVSLIEAMACGLPAISTAVGGVNDILIHEQNGFVIEPGSFDLLYNALEKMLTDASLLVHLGNKACQTVRSNYSIPIIMGKYVQLFSNVMSTDHKALALDN
ncbi:MAG: glycosyltransferase family 4 protein [Planctomycetota bacterium]|jgi:glycosyltransferase involved in cell wall biosynthesis